MGKKIGKIVILFTCAILCVLVLDRLDISVKYISNGLLAICAALIINFLILRKTSKNTVLKKKERLSAIKHTHSFENVLVRPISTINVYAPPKDSGGGRAYRKDHHMWW